MAEPTFTRAVAANYEQAFGHASSYFVSLLLRKAALASGQQILDIATGTGLAAEAALAAVGPAGHVTAADLSPEMVEQARARLDGAPNVSFGVEDGQALTFADNSFHVVLCSLGLVFFPDPQRGLREFYRILRPSGHAFVSVNTVPERAYNLRVTAIMARHVPSLQPTAARLFSLGSETRLRPLFEQAGFQEVAVMPHPHRFPMPSFEAYFEQFERGWGLPGQTFQSLPEESRRTVREETRRSIGDTGGPIEVEDEMMLAGGRK